MDAVVQLNTALQGRYDVDREIGAGGMATVYLARDVKHDRRVALKVLKPELGAVLGVERFLAEIKVTANLQHPNLLPLFDSGEANGLLFYVMPFVDGETLRAKLSREKQLPVDEAVRIAMAIASALAYAHENGVIHRDLKPENILLQSGQPVIADFGIALAVSNAGGGRVTQTGISLGTPQYMSPEQATGDRTIDARTDIYSLGAMLYEMLTGDPPYLGSTSQAIIARVLTEKPRSVRISRPNVPEHVDAAVERALEKLPADRFANAQEFADALSGKVAALRTASMTARLASQSRSTGVLSRFPAPALLAIGAVLGAVAGVSAWALTRPEPPLPIRSRLVLDLGDSTGYRNVGGANIAISRDGTHVVYVGGKSQRSLYVRAMDAVESTPIPKTEDAADPAFSPDGKWIVFTAGPGATSSIRKVPTGGGPPATIAEGANNATWGDHDIILFARVGGRDKNGIWRATPAGGKADRIAVPDTLHGESSFARPRFIQGTDAALVEIHRGDIDSTQLGVVRAGGGDVIHLGIVGVNPRYVASGYIVFGQMDGTVSAVPFDAKRLRVTGPALTVLENALIKSGGATEVAVADNGTLVYIQGSHSERTLARLDQSGTTHPFPGLPSQQFQMPRLSPDGKRIAVIVSASNVVGRGGEVWIYDIASATLAPLVRDGKSSRPEWTPDGRRVVWTYTDGAHVELRWQPWDKSAEAETFLPSDSNAVKSPLGASFSPAGTAFAYVTAGIGPQSDIGIASLTAPRNPRLIPAVATSATEQMPRLSYDGRWLAYQSNESGPSEVYVRPFPGSGGRVKVSTNGGTGPMWAPHSLELFYYPPNSGRLSVATISTTPELAVSRRDTLMVFSQARATATSWQNYDVMRDGKEFIVVGGDAIADRAMIVFNWFDEVKERMTLAGKK